MNSIFFSRFLVDKEITFALHKNFNFIQVCGYAARKGTRERKSKKKVKIEVKKVGFIPHNLREKFGAKGPFISRRFDDSKKPLPTDNVFVSRFFQWRIYDFHEAIECHRESHHPQLGNVPNAPLQTFIELNMTGPKKTKFVEPFTRVAKAIYPFDLYENRSILAFCKDPELKRNAEIAGATMVGDVDLIKKVERGDVMLPDFQYILAHPDILPELVSLRGLLKKKFPTAKLGTLGPNIADLVSKFRNGILYSALRDERELDYGWIEATIGPLDMETQHLEKNFVSLVEDILLMKPKTTGPFITRVFLKTPVSSERLKLNLEPYIGEVGDKGEESDSDDEAISIKR